MSAPRQQVQECSEAPQPGEVVTILALSTEKLGMHVKHETELKAMLSQLSTESSKQSNVSGNRLNSFRNYLSITLRTEYDVVKYIQS